MLFPPNLSSISPQNLEISSSHSNTGPSLLSLSSRGEFSDLTCSNPLRSAQSQSIACLSSKTPRFMNHASSQLGLAQHECKYLYESFFIGNRGRRALLLNYSLNQSKLENKAKSESTMKQTSPNDALGTSLPQISKETLQASHICQIPKPSGILGLLGFPNVTQSLLYHAQSNYPYLPTPAQILLLRFILLNQQLINKLNTLQVLFDRFEQKSESNRSQPYSASSPTSEPNQEDVIIQRETQKQRVKDQIKKAQEDFLKVLREVPNEEQVIFQGRPRGRYRRNGQPFTSSLFRGVSKNGRKYQVSYSNLQMFIMVNGRNKMYMGGFDDPEHAAKCYDKAAIQMRGIKAHTNFSYSKKEVLRILNSRPLFDMERENVSVAWRELRANFD